MKRKWTEKLLDQEKIWSETNGNKQNEVKKLKRNDIEPKFFEGGIFLYVIQHCFICRPSDSTVSEDAGIEPRPLAMTARHSNHLATTS